MGETFNANTETTQKHVRYTVVRNGVASKNLGKACYTGHVVAPHRTFDEVVERTAALKGPYAEEDVRHIADLLLKTVSMYLAEGESVDLNGLATFRPTIRGTFDSSEDAFDQKRHRFGVTVSIGKRLRKLSPAYGIVRI